MVCTNNSSHAKGTSQHIFSGCSFNTTSYLKNTGFETVIATSNGTGGDTSIIIDNTFFPCEGGVYQSEVYLYETLTLTIETNLGY